MSLAMKYSNCVHLSFTGNINLSFFLNTPFHVLEGSTIHGHALCQLQDVARFCWQGSQDAGSHILGCIDLVTFFIIEFHGWIVITVTNE